MKKKNFVVKFIIIVVFFIFPFFVFSQTIEYNNQNSQKIGSFTLTPLPTPTKKPTSSPQQNNQFQQNNNLNQADELNESDQPRSKHNFVYYSQRDPKYKDHKMAGYCSSGEEATIGNAGCGPTTVAMIIASYKDRKIDPIDIVEYYRENNLFLGCGTFISSAKQTLISYGFKIKNKVSTRIDEMKKMIQHGWTLFALANVNDIGHYFWIVDIDKKNNVLVYDPWWSYQRPLPTNQNENQVEWREVFAIKPEAFAVKPN